MFSSVLADTCLPNVTTVIIVTTGTAVATKIIVCAATTVNYTVHCQLVLLNSSNDKLFTNVLRLTDQQTDR